MRAVFLPVGKIKITGNLESVTNFEQNSYPLVLARLRF